MDKILVTGATGKYGKAVVESLIKKGVKKNYIYVMVRDKTKAADMISLGVNLVFGDYNYYTSMIRAFSDIDKLLFVSSNEVRHRSEQHKKVIKAAKKAGVKHIIYTSQQHKSDDRNSPIHFIVKSHLATEIDIMKSGMSFTILRNGLYLDMLPNFLGNKIIENGIFLPAGQGKIAFTLRSEMAETTANILISEGHKNKIYDISGSNISFTEIAEIISQITGKNVTYFSPSLEVFINTAANNGVPKMMAKMLGGFAAAAQQGELECKDSMMEKLLGRKPKVVEEFLKEMYEV